MKIDEIRKLGTQCEIVCATSSDDILGEIIFRIQKDGLDAISVYATENSEKISLFFKDEEILKLRDWLCELYGLPTHD